jgi:nucleotide-binding universal stress UspA family protein
MEIKKILFATDFSEGAAHAVPYAADMAKRYGAKLIIIHVIQDIEKMTAWYAPKVNMDELHRSMEAKAKKELEQSCSGDLKVCNNAEYRLLKGIVHEEILKFQKDNNIDLIIIGTHSRKTVGKGIVFGSTADRVLKQARCPVLTVTPGDEEMPESRNAKLCSSGEIRL